ncbi:hypothetical protein BU14_0422s0010 [Porphyra umbilicalis]|uniref:Uncharacterized protein n=1 Tax=Porphyra umbilicalis TaxID=2786 RepID=A0A1X6NVE3_PORUM|nr:hypothetical protein BU14_0422s0010 [Porphyra umbilicalis]|eukprot:OSX72578.1 hypothetical protein BU14_0422s0010 [Porphyra umbilicalis]
MTCIPEARRGARRHGRALPVAGGRAWWPRVCPQFVTDAALLSAQHCAGTARYWPKVQALLVDFPACRHRSACATNQRSAVRHLPFPLQRDKQRLVPPSPPRSPALPLTGHGNRGRGPLPPCPWSAATAPCPLRGILGRSGHPPRTPTASASRWAPPMGRRLGTRPSPWIYFNSIGRRTDQHVTGTPVPLTRLTRSLTLLHVLPPPPLPLPSEDNYRWTTSSPALVTRSSSSSPPARAGVLPLSPRCRRRGCRGRTQTRTGAPVGQASSGGASFPRLDSCRPCLPVAFPHFRGSSRSPPRRARRGRLMRRRRWRHPPHHPPPKLQEDSAQRRLATVAATTKGSR